MKLKAEISNIALYKPLSVFIVVQLKATGVQYEGRKQKFRTDVTFGKQKIYADSSRPKFKNNVFSFNILKRQNYPDDFFTMKFGLMLVNAKNLVNIQQEQIVNFVKIQNAAKPVAFASINLSYKRLKQLTSDEQSRTLSLMIKNKQVGQFNLKLKSIQNKNALNKQQREKINEAFSISGKEAQIFFNPFVSRIVFDQNCSDPLREKSSIQMLQKQLDNLYKKIFSVKQEEQKFESILTELQNDQQQIKQQIDMLQKVNSKITSKLNSKESLQNLRLEIDMLRNTSQGKNLLLQKLEYFQDRIFREEEQYQKLNIQYKKIKPQIQKKIKKAEQYGEKLKGKEQQQFQIRNNEQILQNFEDILFQFQSNQSAIKSLVNLSKNSPLTAQQASLLLSQVQYQIKLQQYVPNNAHQQQILSKIQNQALKNTVKQEQLSEELALVYGIKLQSLMEQVQRVKIKISKVKSKN